MRAVVGTIGVGRLPAGLLFVMCVAVATATAGCGREYNSAGAPILSGGDSGQVEEDAASGAEDAAEVAEDGSGEEVTPDAPGPAPDTAEGGSTVCTPGVGRCSPGDLLERCNADGTALIATPCQDEGAFCGVADDGVAGCLPWVCEPGAPLCIGERDRADCNLRGSDFIVDLRGCPSRCEEGVCVADPAQACGDLEVTPLELGSVLEFDLCGEGDDFANTEGNPSCGANGVDYPGRDRVFSLTLERPTAVLIDLADADGNAAIDTVLYVRSACQDRGSQLACGDDVTCGESDVDSGCQSPDQVQVRQSQLGVELGAGTWFVVADHYAYSQNGQSFGCGVVRLRVEGL